MGTRKELRAHRRRQQLLLADICRFLPRYALSGSGTQLASSASLQDLLDSIPFARHSKIADIAVATYEDGSGVLSTLTCLMYMHFLGALPEGMQAEILDVLKSFDFDPYEYGWLSFRVLETAIYMTIDQGPPRAAVEDTLGRAVSENNRNLRLKTSAFELTEEKWHSRSELRHLAGLKD